MTRTLAMALLCAGAILVFPLEILILGSILWFPLLIWRAHKAGPKHGFIFVALVSAIVAWGVSLPNRHDVKRFGPYPGSKATFAQLAATRAIFSMPDRDSEVILLPSENPTRKEILGAITNQTNLRGRIRYCASGCNLLTGPSGGPISLKTPDRVQTPP